VLMIRFGKFLFMQDQLLVYWILIDVYFSESKIFVVFLDKIQVLKV